MKWLLVSAGLLAIGMIAAGVMAGSTLRQRDAVVREGLLTKAGHDIERELREGGPAVAAEVLTRYAAGGGNVSALELRTDDRVLQTAGVVRSGAPVEVPVALGPSWRGLAGFRMGRGHSPFSLRLWASPDVGDSSMLAALTTWGSIFAALALLAFAAGAARGVTARQRAESLDGERRRLEVVSAAGAGLAHRIRNPLATIKATAQVLESQSEGTARERSTRIVDASLRIESLVNELLRFARPVELHEEELDLAEAARSVVDDVEGSGAVLVRADREHVTAAIEELVANARALGDEHPRVVAGRRGRHAFVDVLDRGPGLQLEAERAFEPYVTTRPNGTGLGLPAIRGLIRANGGDVTLANREGGGCVATIVLPVVTG